MRTSPSRAQVREAVIKVLQEIQTLSGYACPHLNDAMKPLGGELDGFDSLLAVEATVAIEAALELDVGCDNLFLSEDGARTLTIAETIDRLMRQETQVARQVQA